MLETGARFRKGLEPENGKIARENVSVRYYRN